MILIMDKTQSRGALNNCLIYPSFIYKYF